MPLLPPVSASMNFEPVASADGVNENPEPRPVPAIPLSETFKAGWQRDNDIYNTMKWLDRQTNYGEPDFDFLGGMYQNHIQGTDLETYADSFTGVRNQKEFDALAAQIREERRTTSILEASNPAAAFLASGVASIVSPTTLIPVYGVARSVRVGATALKTALAAGASNAAAAAIQEGILHGTQATRTQGETAMAIGGSFLLANILGGAAGGLSAAKFKKLSTALEDLQVSANIDRSYARQAYEASMSQEARSAGAAAITRPDAELKGALGLEKTISQTGPWGRTMNSPVPSVREAEVRNVEAPGSLTRNREGYSTAPIGGSIETRIKTQGVSHLGQALQELQRIYLDYRFGDPNTKLPGFKNLTSPDKTKMSDREFYQLVGSVASRMDKHENPFVAKAAEVFREKLIEPIAANAVRERLLNPELVRKGRPAKAATVADQKKKLEEWAGPKATPAQRKPVDDLLTQIEEFSGVKFDKAARDYVVDRLANNPENMDRLRRAFYGNEDLPFALRDVRGQHIRRVMDDLEDGYPYVQDRAVVDRVEAIAKDVRLSLPEGVRDVPVHVMVGVQPKAGDMVEISFRGIDGGFRTVDMTLAEFGAARAFSIDGGVFLTRTDLVGDVSQMVGGEVRHELVHALRAQKRINTLVARSLFGHAESLGVLDMPLRDYLQKVGDDAWEQASALPVRDVYTKQYSKMSDEAQAEALAQEAIAHMVELRHHGHLTDEQLAPILDDLDNLFGKPVPVGEAQKRIVGEWIADLGYAVKAESDGSIKFALRGSDIDVGRSMRAELDRLGYFSGALEAAKRLRQNKGTPEQMLAMLQKEGAKKAEIEATGLDKLLAQTDAPNFEKWGARITSSEALDGGSKKIQLSGDGKGPSPHVVYREAADAIYIEGVRGGRNSSGRGNATRAVKALMEYAVATNRKVIATSTEGAKPYWNIMGFRQDGANSVFDVKQLAGLKSGEINSTIWGHEKGYGTAFEDVYGPPGSAIDEGKKSITKSEIIKYLEDNRVDVREVARGTAVDDYLGPGRTVRRPADGTTDIVKWQPYSLDPNNPTYRETVLHLPPDMRKAKADWEATYNHDGLRPDARKPWDSLSDADKEYIARKNVEEFRSGHFPEPNIIGHMQTSLVKHEGKPTYLIDQIQSDWGQKLRDGGVRDEAKIAELKKRLEEARRVRDEWLMGEPLEFVRKHVPSMRADDVNSGDVQNNLMRIARSEPSLGKLSEDVLEKASEYRLDPRMSHSIIDRLRAEINTAEAATPGHPLVNTTDQWTTTTLRRAIRQAVEADAEYIAVPTGDTVLSYNPGDTEGMWGFYGHYPREALAKEKTAMQRLAESEQAPISIVYKKEAEQAGAPAVAGIVPKNLKNILRKIDKSSPDPVVVDKLETPGSGMKGEGFTLFKLTDKVKQTVKEQGQPLFAMRGLDMSPEARKQRAEEMGFDTSRVWYHASPTKEFEAFRKDLIGNHTDSGHLGRGFYFADNNGEARYYADHVGAYYVRGKLLDVGGGGTWPEMFKQWAPHVEKLGLLGDRVETLSSIKKIDDLVDRTATVTKWDNDGVEGYYASMPDPTDPSFDIGIHARKYDTPKTKEEALDKLKHTAYYKLEKSEDFPGLDLIDTYTDFVRTGGRQDSITEAAERAGYSGIQYGSEIVVFDPSNIRSVNAAFDPSEAGSANLMFAMRGLDMSPEARKARAEEMGFDTSRVWYHGTTKEFDAFDPAKANRAGGVARAFYLTPSTDLANYFSRPSLDGSRVIPVYIKRDINLFDYRNERHIGALVKFLQSKTSQQIMPGYLGAPDPKGFIDDAKLGSAGLLELPAVQKWLRRKGFAGWHSTEGVNQTPTLALLNPSDVRSVNAAFDPSEAGSANLMFALRDLSRRLDAPLVDDLGKSDPHPGRVMAVHGTKAQPFDQFDPAKSADFGIHFGTKDQADIPAGYTTTRENARMIPVVLDLKTVVDVPDMMTWPPVEVAAAVEKAYPLARGLEDRVRAVIAAGSTETGPTGSVRPSREALAAGKAELRRLMTEAKIDGLRYWNDSEGEGWSYIVWDEGKVSSATSGEPMMGVKPDGQPQFALRGNGEDILKKVRDLGGIKDETGDLANMGAGDRKGIINNETGLSPDAMRAHMVEQGYLDDVPYEDVTQSSVNDLYDMISEALSDQGGRGRAYREEMAYQAIRAVQKIIDDNGLEIKLTPEQEDALVKMILDRRMSPDDALERMQMAGAEDAPRVGASNVDPLRYTQTRREMEALKEAVEAQYKMGHDPLEGQYFNDDIGDEVWGGTPGQSYIMRLYNHEKIIRRRTQFRSILADYFQQSQQRATSALRRMERDIADAEARALQSGREYKMSQNAEKDLSDLRAFVDMDRAELEKHADGVIDNILGRPDLLTFDLPESLRGALKSRTLRIPDAFESASGKFEDFLDRDVRAIGRAYVHSVVVDTEIMRMHGSLTMEEWPIYKKMEDEYHALVNNPELDKLPPAKAEKIRARLEKDWKRATRDLQAQIDRMRGIYKLPDDPTHWGPRTIRVIKELNLLRMLGGMTVSALSDIPRVVMVHGFTDTLRYGIRPLFGHLRALRLAGDEVQLSGTALDMILGSRIQAIADVLDNYGRYSKGERGLGWAAEKFGYLTLMNQWNSAMKQWVGAVTMTKIIKACKRVADGTATKADIDKLAASSIIDKATIDTFAARKIAEQFDKHGMIEGGLHIPNSQAWDVSDPNVRLALDALRGAIVRDVDNIIVTPGQEKPLWFSTQMGSVILQFKSFAASSMEKTLIAGLQQRDAGVFMGASLMVGLGALVEYLKALTNDKPLPANNAQWVAAAIDRSGLLGWFSDVNNVTEKMTRGTIGVSALTGKELSRFASRNVIDALAGPTFGTIGDMTVASGGLFSSLIGGQQVRQSDLAAIRRLIPMQNLFYLSNIFQQLEKSAGKSLGAKQGKSRSPLMDRLSSNEQGPGWLDEFVRAA